MTFFELYKYPELPQQHLDEYVTSAQYNNYVKELFMAQKEALVA